jgi:hypothetical protein
MKEAGAAIDVGSGSGFLHTHNNNHKKNLEHSKNIVFTQN